MFAFVDTDGSFDVQPGDIADIIKMSFDVDENMKMQIINNRMPRANFKFPGRHYVDKSRKTRISSLYCQASWFKIIKKSIIKSIEFYNTNGIAVRGHLDDGSLASSDISKQSRNLRSLINFRIDAGDKI